MTISKQRRPARVLTNLKIKEISCVDRGAGESCNVTLLKRRDGRTDYERLYRKIFGVPEPRRKRMRHSGYPTAGMVKSGGGPRDSIPPVHGARGRLADPDADGVLDLEDIDPERDDERDLYEDDRRENDDDNNGSTDPYLAGSYPNEGMSDESTDQLEAAERAMSLKSRPSSAAVKHLDELADLLVVAAKGELSKADALHWLMFTQQGRTVAARSRYMHKRKHPMQSHSGLLSDVVKRYGIVAFCKSVSAGDVTVSEHELTKLIEEQAKREGTSFSKMFCDPGEQGLALRKAIAVAKDAQFVAMATGKAATLVPRFVGGENARAVNNPRSALSQLNDLVAEQRRQHPTLSEAQAFERVYTDPKNRDLAARERAQNRPTATG